MKKRDEGWMGRVKEKGEKIFPPKKKGGTFLAEQEGPLSRKVLGSLQRSLSGFQNRRENDLLQTNDGLRCCRERQCKCSES